MYLTGKEWNIEFRARMETLQDAVDRRIAGEAEPADTDRAVAGIAALTDACRHYLAASFGPAAKRECAAFAYGWLLSRIRLPALSRMMTWHHEVWSAEVEGVRYSATIYVEIFVAREGALTLEMFTGETSLYLLTFTIVPGARVGVGENHAILVSRLQGRPNLFDEFRRATKALSDVAPRALLFAALMGFAKASGIRFIAGVSGENTLNVKAEKREDLERQYDAFFQSLDATGPDDGFYLVDLEAEPKPVNEVKAGHRIRTRRKRQFKAVVAETVAQAWGSRFLHARKATAEPAAVETQPG